MCRKSANSQIQSLFTFFPAFFYRNLIQFHFLFRLYWIEYSAIAIVGCSLVYYLGRYLYYSIIWEPVEGTEEQKRLLQFDDKDASFVVRKKTPPKVVGRSATNNATLNFSNLSCSFNDSHNISGFSSPNRSHINSSLNAYSSANNTKPQSAFSSPYMAVNADNDLFMEPSSLNNLLE